MSHTFFALGCSCTAVVGWTKHFREELQLNLIDLSEGSSSNLSQIIKLKNYLLNSNLIDKLDQVVLLWQITSPARKTGVLEKSIASNPYQNSYAFPGHEDYRDYFTYNLKFDQREVVGLLSHNPFFEDKKFNLYSTDAQFEQTIFDIVILSKLVKHTVIWYGWKDLDTPARLENINNVLNQQKNKIRQVFIIQNNKYHFN